VCEAVNGSRKPKSEDCEEENLLFHNITTGALTISCVCTLREIKIISWDISTHRTQARHRIFRDFSG
jgi:hypothetical protein